MCNRIYLSNIGFFPFESREQLLDHVKKTNTGILFAVNARKIITSPDYVKYAITNNIGYIDGIGTIWAAKRMGYAGKPTKIPGVELWLELIKTLSNRKIYLLGSKDDVIERTVAKLKTEFHHIHIVGYKNGYFNDSSLPEIVQDIKSKQAELVFVALGSPKQEIVMIEMSKQHKALYMGLGGSFDVYCGKVKRAPVFFQKYGLEGFYRLVVDPKRLVESNIYYIIYIYKLILGRF